MGRPAVNDGRIMLIDRDELAPGAEGLVRIEPMFSEFWATVPCTFLHGHDRTLADACSAWRGWTQQGGELPRRPRTSHSRRPTISDVGSIRAALIVPAGL